MLNLALQHLQKRFTFRIDCIRDIRKPTKFIGYAIYDLFVKAKPSHYMFYLSKLQIDSIIPIYLFTKSASGK